jgi:hypothetical protein
MIGANGMQNYTHKTLNNNSSDTDIRDRILIDLIFFAILSMLHFNVAEFQRSNV